MADLTAPRGPRAPAATRISPLARVDPSARIGAGCAIGDFTIVHGNVELGDGSVVDSHCVLGYPTPLAEGRPLSIGPGSLIRSHSVFYEGSRIGPGLRTGHHATVREKTVAGAGFQVGTQADIQGHCAIGDHVHTHSGVQVNHGSTVGDFAWLLPFVVLTNDPHPPSDVQVGPSIGRYAVLAARATVLPGIRVGDGALVGAGSVVTKDVDAHTVVAGVPARLVGPTSDVRLRTTGAPAYPWPRHFRRGYPPDVVAQWDREFGPVARPAGSAGPGKPTKPTKPTKRAKHAKPAEPARPGGAR